MTRAATRAIAALVAARAPHEVLRYHHDPHRHAFGVEAVEQLAADDGRNGCSTGLVAEQVYKTLVLALPQDGCAAPAGEAGTWR